MHFESIASGKSGRLPGFEPCLAHERTGRRSLGGRLTDKCRGGRAQSSLDWVQPGDDQYGGGYTEYVARTGHEAPGLRS